MADAYSRILADIAYPRSSAKPTRNTGKEDEINQNISLELISNTIERGIKPKDRSGINTRMLM